MGLRAVKFVGSKREAFLPDWIEFSTRIVDHPNVRSYSPFSGQTKTTYHDTGNPTTRAEGEYAWLAAGRPGGEKGGYNFIFDDGKIIHATPLNEVTWHAGTPLGNQTSWGAEHSFGNGVDWMKSLQVGAALHGALIEMQGLDPDAAAVLHQYWYGKYCSAQILNRGQWPMVKGMIRDACNAARAARSGKPGDAPAPAPPGVVAPMPVLVDGKPWDGAKDVTVNGILFHAQKSTVTVAVDALNGRQFASTISGFTNGGKKAGEKIAVLGWVGGELVDGEPRWWLAVDGTRYWAGGIVEQPSDRTDHKQPDNGQAGVKFINGRAYYPLIDPATGKLGRTLAVTAPSNLRRWAGTESAITGAKQTGDAIRAEYWTLGESVNDEQVWYVLDQGEPDRLTNGARIWAGVTSDRPK